MSKRLSSQKLNRVKWAPDANLCQVKLFLPEGCPSQVGSKAEDHLQAKTSWMLHSKTGSDDRPPGFGGKRYSDTLKQSCILQIKWKCPPRFIMNSDWHVAAGELSEETGAQKYREMRVLEAFYPCPSAIPLSPSVSPDVEECDYDDRGTPLIPVNPIDEEDAVDHASPPCHFPACSNSVVKEEEVVAVTSTQCDAPAEPKPPIESKLAVNEKSLGISTGLEADVVAAASAAFTAIMKSSEKGSMIDTDLLIKILTDPKMIEKLSKDLGSNATAKVTQESKPMLQKPLDENIIHDPFHQKLQSASNASPTSQASGVPTLPLSKTKLHTVTSSEGADENSNQFSKAHEHSSNSFPSIPVSSLESQAMLSHKLEDVNQLLKVLLSNQTSLSNSGFKVTFSSANFSEPEKTISRKLVDEELGLPRKAPTNSCSSSLGSNATSVDLFTQPDRYSLQSPVNLDLKPSQPSMTTTLSIPKPTTRASMLTQEPSKAVSPKPEDLFISHRTDMVLTKKANQILDLDKRFTWSSSRSSSPPDRLPVSSISSSKNPAVKDANYYKSLVKLHGVERQESQEKYIPHYKSRVSEFAALSDLGDAREKIRKPCKYFNSPKGCRKGFSCPYQHDSLLQLQSKREPDARSGKRPKLSREIAGM